MAWARAARMIGILPGTGLSAALSALLSPLLSILLLAAPLAILPIDSAAAATPRGSLDGAGLSLLWALPFVGTLLSIALLPALAPRFWHHHYGKVALGWGLAFLVPFVAIFGGGLALHEVAHAALLEYLPFVILLFALFTVSGGILVTGNLHGSPLTNTTLLAMGTVLASVIGTTGASMVLIRPLLRANDDRRYNIHTVIFFIFLVANVGGVLTPLGDPPLFLGFLKGVNFFWTTTHLLRDFLIVAGILLTVFFLMDWYFYARERRLGHLTDPTPDTGGIGLRGVRNLPLLVGIIGAILLSALWKPGVTFDVLGTPVELQWIARDATLLAIALLSLALTPRMVRERNGFDFEPILEVGKLFAAIFLTIIPVVAMLRAGHHGAFSGLVTLVTGPDGQPVNAWYFWLTGALSSFLDNAPTYLIFFNLAGGDPHHLMGPLKVTLEALSVGAVFMGAMTYVGNAPNFMVASIARNRGVKMPSFFGYMAWSGLILLPCFALLTILHFL